MSTMAQSIGGSLPEGSDTPFGTIVGGLPQGFGYEWHQLLFQQADAAAKNALAQAKLSGYLDSLPTLERQQVEAQIQQEAARTAIQSRLADNTIRQTDLDTAFKRAQLAANPRNYLEASFYDQSRGGLGGFAPTNQLSSGKTPYASRSAPVPPGNAYDQPQMTAAGVDSSAAAAASPSAYGTSDAQGSPGSMTNSAIARGREPLGWGAPPGSPPPGADSGPSLAHYEASQYGTSQDGASQYGPSQYSTGQYSTGQESRTTGGTAATQPALGEPGGLDHYATQENPDGTKIHYFGTPVTDSDGNVANVPVGAFSRALLEGRRVPGAGALSGLPGGAPAGPRAIGGYTFGEAIRNALDPSQLKVADYLRGTPSEQQQLKGLASYAGYSDDDTDAALKDSLPKEGSVAHGLAFLS